MKTIEEAVNQVMDSNFELGKGSSMKFLSLIYLANSLVSPIDCSPSIEEWIRKQSNFLVFENMKDKCLWVHRS